ncbi:(2Fe-2S)-binding protein [Lentibacillus amyloliquefaciens]|uniref:Sarcosine oxidase subunit alpha n=1 Tax=Lentibacillus amyloliquefaciens TaxID=1472767 RepID=A0A0U4FQR9_9BACI|nr:(2Fe-2S)-binding protein [Lentibacillus amyloliquefaciens]ALX50052.1 sarcosine oxidase subunit alpha [Lentibacillus amyloliquefaciens]
MSERIYDHPVLGALKENEYVTFSFNDEEYKGLKDESLAAALLANGIRTLRHHEETGRPRGVYCNIGHCFECRVKVNGKSGVRACLTPLKEGMVVESGGKLPTPVRDWRAENE